MTSTQGALSLVVVVFGVGCGSAQSSGRDGAAPDSGAGSSQDSGVVDSGAPDASVRPPDAGPVSCPYDAGVANGSCVQVCGGNAASFVSQTVPSQVNAGGAFSITVTMQNTGTTTWSRFPVRGHFLGSQNPQDNSTWGTNRGWMDPSACVPPGRPYTFTFSVTAPSAPGSYPMQWQMLEDAVEWFGQKTPLLNVNVVQPAFPPVPSRDQVLGINLQFQGLRVTTAQYGELPWFEAALAWLTPADRQAVYSAKHAVGDTHCIIALPSGPPLYDEPNQPYSADRFGPLDWTHGNTAMDPQFVALVEEVILAGFTPLIFLGGDAGDVQGFPIAMAQLPLVTNALAQSQYGDLNLYVVKIPGWDGVFYGYTPQHVQQYGDYARQLSPNGYVGIEHNTGHIPVGNGPADYAPGGMMSNFDLVMSEFDNGTARQGYANDSVWQIVGRLTRPYNRPPDQPADDDPNPPFYLAPGTARGAYSYGCFEFEEYTWVHQWYSLDEPGKQALQAQIATERAYLQMLGCQHTG
jgi:hypothetical protein